MNEIAWDGSQTLRLQKMGDNMRWIIVVMIGFLLMGCSQPIDISSAYWKDKNETRNKNFPDWPDWQKVPRNGVKFGKNDSWAMEYVSFVWDETGIYGKVFGFGFPTIAVHPELETIPEFPPYLPLTVKPQDRSLRSHGKVKAFCFEKDKYVGVISAYFKTKDWGWVMKPGQCVTEFWISWKAINPDESPIKTTIRVKDRKLILDPAKEVAQNN